jgi:hypothetical protein
MTKFIQLTQIVSEAVQEARMDELTEQETVTEVSPPITQPMSINVTQVREFYARKEGKPGTRISMIGAKDEAGRAPGLVVAETYEQVKAAIDAALS